MSGTLLVIGTSIGAGMLGLPVETAQIGFAPVFFSYLLCWVATTLSAMLFLQLQIKLRAHGNISAMVHSTMGIGVARIVEVLFALFYYSLLIAYLKAFMQVISDTYPNMPYSMNAGVTTAFFGGCLLFKEGGINKVNATLVVGLIITYVLIVVIGTSHFQPQAFLRTNWQDSVFSIPLIVTAFGFHVIIPSLYNHQGEDPATTRISILIGTTITLLIYLIWQAIVIGVVPLESLIQAHGMDQTAVIPMSKVLQVPFLPIVGKLFGFFALASSCLGVSIAFYDFILDKFRISNSRKSKAVLLSLMFIPPLIITSSKIQVFYLALRYGGGFGVLLLLVALPVVMTISQTRKEHATEKSLSLRREKTVIAILLIFCLAALAANGLLLSR